MSTRRWPLPLWRVAHPCYGRVLIFTRHRRLAIPVRRQEETRSMPQGRPLVRIAVVLALAIAPALVLADAKPPLKGDPVRGKTVYGKTCILCHFADGSGG